MALFLVSAILGVEHVALLLTHPTRVALNLREYLSAGTLSVPCQIEPDRRRDLGTGLLEQTSQHNV